MPGWHPLTKLLLFVALLAVPYLLWTVPDEAPAALTERESTNAERARSIDELRRAGTPLVPVVARAVQLPPLDSFTGIVERPLFSPMRRPPEAPAEPEPEAAAEPQPAAGPSEPQFRLVGTVRQRGRIYALLSPAAGGQLLHATLGDTVEGWEVVKLEAGEMVVRQAEEERQLVILK